MMSCAPQRSVVVLAACLVLPSLAGAQRFEVPRAGFSAANSGPAFLGGAEVSISERLNLGRARTSYWLEGGIVTAVPAMIAFNLVYDSDRAGLVGRVVGSAIAGVIFSVPGMVIGGLFPKE